MKKITFLLGMLFLFAFPIYSQNPDKVINKADIETFTKTLSIVNFNPKTNTITAWANEKQFRDFELLNIPFEVPTSENQVDDALIYDNCISSAKSGLI